MQKEHREAAERVVDRYLAVLKSRASDAGWQGAGILGRIIEFQGELPDSSGFSGFSTVWEKGQHLRNWSHKHIAAVRMVSQLTPAHREAVVIDRDYRGRTKVAIDPFVPDRQIDIHWDDARIAVTLGITVTAFRNRVYRGYMQLAALMGVKESDAESA